MLICENISLSYNEKLIFKNISICIFQKSVIFIRGANGSGKTSFLKILSGILKPDNGSVSYEEDDIHSNMYYWRNMINYIAHIKSVKNSLTLLENIEFWANIYNNPELVPAAIYYFGLTEYIDSRVETLSTGIKHKIELTRLIIKQSKVWILDEPEINLDKQSRNLLNNLIMTKSDQGGIIIIASHNDYNINNSIDINIDDYKIIKKDSY